MRSTVSSSIVRGPGRRKNCLGDCFVLSGQSRVPLPPARIDAYIVRITLVLHNTPRKTNPSDVNSSTGGVLRSFKRRATPRAATAFYGTQAADSKLDKGVLDHYQN